MNITVPPLGESIKDATIARWLKDVGASFQMDEPMVELETDKITVEINAPVAGTLVEVMAPQGTNVQVGSIIGRLEEGAVKASAPAPVQTPVAKAPILSPAAAKIAQEQKRDPATFKARARTAVSPKKM